MDDLRDLIHGWRMSADHFRTAANRKSGSAFAVDRVTAALLHERADTLIECADHLARRIASAKAMH